jgi:creatinine amidohydrolase/Fe(II)-dependent formamide hydrolase-like protein
METSFYLHIDSSKVKKDKLVKDAGYPLTDFFSMDSGKPGSASFPLPWRTFSKTGVQGDPTVATAEKGDKWLDAAAERMALLVKEFKRVASDVRPDSGGKEG